MTIIEVMTVLIILAVLASLTIGVAVTIKKRAMATASSSILKQVVLALDAYRADYHYYPPASLAANLAMSKQLYAALGEQYRCADCTYVHNRAEHGMKHFNSLPSGWTCPDCGAVKARFGASKNYLPHLNLVKHLGHGEWLYDHDNNPATAKIGIDVTGAILDAWGQPLVYIYEQPLPANILPPELNPAGPYAPDPDYTHKIENQYILYSFGPD